YGDGLGDGWFHPADPAAVPPDRYITVTAYDRVLPGSVCGQPWLQDSRLTADRCEPEPGGLIYRHDEIQQGYQVQVGDWWVTVVGTPGVPRDTVRAAVASLHPAGEDRAGVFAATVPGYTGQATGMPDGMVYSPDDHMGSGARSVGILL